MKTIAEKHQTFSDIEKNVPDLNSRMLSLRLSELENRWLIERTVSTEKPVKIRYTLSATWSSFSVILKKLCQRIQKNYKSSTCPIVSKPIA